MRYTLATVRHAGQDAGGKRWLLETYPHPVIIELLALAECLPCKVSRARRYWPGDSPRARGMVYSMVT